MSTATTPTSGAVTPERLAAARKAVISSSLGAALEWFDVIVYASFAVVIAHNFFPGGDNTLGLILTFATFAISYVIRPLGGMVLGSYADRRGRKNALTLTMMLMMIGTLIMAVAPTTSMIGPWAGVVILVSRLIQGFSAGGEFGTATTFLVETAPHKKAFYSSWQVASQGASVFLASLFGYVLNTHLSHEALYSWGWRVPFFFGIIVGPVGLYIRAKLDETDDFKTSVPEKAPLKTTLTRHLGRVLTGAAVVGVATISIYLILYMPTFAVKNLGVSASAGYLGGIVAGLVTLITVPLIGHLADRVGPARVMTWAAVAAIVLAWPLFKLMVDHPSTLTLVLVVSALGVIMAFAFGPLPALMSSLFPAEIRATGMSLSYNLGVTLLGGIAPLVLTWLISTTGSLDAPSYYYMTVAVLSLGGLWSARTLFSQK
ncbi:MFS transporter [Rhodococcus erythropolis]|jgi:MHS family proline/betaine transporter-like MFS transporter|uniref:Putative proline/betaine transporter n=2 Tax=Rhodococcus erythropolis TaxID=1833 RepID=A0A0E4A1X8_RHOER|nr:MULTISPECIES: MFS transporter [Rhodococcus]ERB55580.1 membrane protein [Rhodococcus sp. P27]AGT90226.1 MFS transporter [Rhodococcus erythropolis CCM2595]AKD95685.1 membrane protein [Rhodococcus erythropolis]ALU67887.1 membrane protein [Rhodococcus erythropolis R138]EQM33153.1 membrane protein [Rhodococcus erythropolis DN1]